MEYQLIGRGVEVTQSLRNYAEKKVSKMERYFKGADVRCTITFSLVKKLYQIAEVSIQANGMYLRAKVTDQKDAYAALDLCVDKLEGQMRKLKTQVLKSKKRNDFAKDIVLEAIENGDDKEEIDKIVKRKKISLSPMDTEEALARMDALDHNFFIFLDSETNNRCVLYKRDDGTYGLIEVE